MTSCVSRRAESWTAVIASLTSVRVYSCHLHHKCLISITKRAKTFHCHRCQWAVVTTSKLLPIYNLVVLKLLPFVICLGKKADGKIYRATMCNFWPPGIKVNRTLPPQHLSLTLMSCLPWNGVSPVARITDIPKAATGSREADGNKPRRATLCFAAVVVVAVSRLVREKLSTDYTHRQQNLNVPTITEKFPFE